MIFSRLVFVLIIAEFYADVSSPCFSVYLLNRLQRPILRLQYVYLSVILSQLALSLDVRELTYQYPGVLQYTHFRLFFES